MAKLGKKHKGKTRDAKKGAGLSEEERAMQDRMRRMEEANARKLLAAKLRKELKVRDAAAGAAAARDDRPPQARLDAEQRNSKINRMRIQNQWRKIMRLAKVRLP